MSKKIFNLENYCLLIILILPVYMIRLSFFSFRFNMLDVLIVVAVFWWALREKSAIKEKVYLFYKNNKIFVLALGLILSGLFLSCFLNENILRGLGIIKSWFILPALFGFLIFSLFLEDRSTQVKMLPFKAYFCAAFFISCISLALFFIGYRTYDFRLEGIFNSPNYLAMYIAPALLWFIIFFLGNTRKNYEGSVYKNFLYFCFFVISIVLFLTKSYASWFALGLTIFIYYLFFKKNLKKIIVFSLIFMVLLFFHLSFNEKFQELASFNERSSLASRLMIWKSAGIIIKDNFLVGIGPGNFQNFYLEYQKYFSPYLEWAVPHPHNIFLNFWTSGGLLSLLGFTILIIIFCRAFSTNKKKKAFLVAFFVLLYFLIHGMVDATYFKNDLSLIFWIAYFGLL